MKARWSCAFDPSSDARLRTIVAALGEKPEGSAPAAFDRWVDVKALYRIWDSSHVDAQDI
jgi:hypothetical protein